MNTGHVYDLARVNGCDQPDSARVYGPKTPAARAWVPSVAGHGQKPSGSSALASVQGGEEVA